MLFQKLNKDKHYITTIVDIYVVIFVLQFSMKKRSIVTHNRGFTIRQIKSAFHFGSTKIKKTIPVTPKRSSMNFKPGALANIY